MVAQGLKIRTQRGKGRQCGSRRSGEEAGLGICLEQSQNSLRMSWSFEEVDAKLHDIMVNIFAKVDDAGKRYGVEGNYVAGANIAGFEKVVEAMIAQGVV